MLDAILISAAQFPTVVVYLMDTVRSTNPVTFMSNMLYACSILYKTKLPFIVAMNKTDVVDNKYAVEWMEDFEIFQVTIRTLLFIDLIYSFSIKAVFLGCIYIHYFVVDRKPCNQKGRTFQTLHNQCL